MQPKRGNPPLLPQKKLILNHITGYFAAYSSSRGNLYDSRQTDGGEATPGLGCSQQE